MAYRKKAYTLKEEITKNGTRSVSYTHLDVYKRQGHLCVIAPVLAVGIVGADHALYALHPVGFALRIVVLRLTQDFRIFQMVTGIGIIVSFYRIGRQLRVVDAGAVSGDQPSIKLIRRQKMCIRDSICPSSIWLPYNVTLVSSRRLAGAFKKVVPYRLGSFLKFLRE